MPINLNIAAFSKAPVVQGYLTRSLNNSLSDIKFDMRAKIRPFGNQLMMSMEPPDEDIVDSTPTPHPLTAAISSISAFKTDAKQHAPQPNILSRMRMSMEPPNEDIVEENEPAPPLNGPPISEDEQIALNWWLNALTSTHALRQPTNAPTENKANKPPPLTINTSINMPSTPIMVQSIDMSKTGGGGGGGGGGGRRDAARWHRHYRRYYPQPLPHVVYRYPYAAQPYPYPYRLPMRRRYYALPHKHYYLAQHAHNRFYFN
jgi:hypothetical protein